MIEMLGQDPGNDGMPSDALCIAKLLLVMAEVPPTPGASDHGDQYRIDSFKISADKIEIRNHGIAHRLQVEEV